MLYFTYMIITRYGLFKITGINQSVFSKMWDRHQAGEDFYSFFTPDGKIDIEDAGFIKKYSHKIKPEELEKLENKKNKNIKKNKVVVKKVTVKKVKPEPPPKTAPEKPKDEELQKLARKANIAKHRKDIAQADKAEMELDVLRGALIPMETLGDTCFGYLSSLNLNIMDLPKTLIDDFQIGIEKDKTRSELIQILTSPICEQISNTIIQLEKEIKKYKKNLGKKK